MFLSARNIAGATFADLTVGSYDEFDVKSMQASDIETVSTERARLPV
jgi:hypothetical protein